jgi:O-antigen ligase
LILEDRRQRLMHIALAALFFFAILTLWVPGTWPVTTFEVGVFALAGAVVLRALRRPLPFSWPLVPLAGAALWGLLQWWTGQTAYGFATKNAVVHWTAVLGVFVVGLALFRETAVRRWFRAAMLWFAVVVAVLATVQTYTSQGRVLWIFPTPYTSTFMPPFPYHNHYAAFIEVVLPIALYEALRRERGVLLYGAMAAALYASVIASASRSGTLLVTAEIVVVIAAMWLRGRASGRAVGMAAGIVVLACAAFVAVAGAGSLWARVQTPDPVRPRIALDSLHMVAAHPWFGCGLGTWPAVYPRFASADFGRFVNQAHCDWLQWAAEGGIPFALLIGSLFVWTLRRSIRRLWGLGAVAVFLHAAVDYPFSRPALAAWPVLIIAMLAARQLDHSASGCPPGPRPTPLWPFANSYIEIPKFMRFRQK